MNTGSYVPTFGGSKGMAKVFIGGNGLPATAGRGGFLPGGATEFSGYTIEGNIIY